MNETPDSGAGDGLYRLLAWLERSTPRFVYLWISERLMGPERAARVVKYLRRETLPSVVQGLSPAFSASVAPMLTDEAIGIIVEQVQIETLVNVSRALVKAGHYQTMARFGTLMGTSRTKAFIVALNDMEAIAHTARFYDPDTLKRVAETFSGQYGSKLAAALDRLGYHDVEAELGRLMSPEHLAPFLRNLQPVQAMRFFAKADQRQIDQVLARLQEDRASAIMQSLMDLRTGR